MLNIPVFHDGQALSPQPFEALRQGVLRTGLDVTPPMTMTMGSESRHLVLDLDEPILAVLSGSSSPYSWTQVFYNQASNTWSNGARSGTTNAYEVNGKASLNGKRVELFLGFSGDYRFYWVGLVTVVCNAPLALTFTDACTGLAISGATVTATGPGTTVTGTTDALGQVTLIVDTAGSWSITATKTGYQNSTLAITAVCSTTETGSGTFSKVTPTTINFTVANNCTGVAISGATVQAVQGATTVSGTTDGSGHCTLTVTTGGVWSLTVSKTGSVTWTGSVTVSCWTVNPVLVALAPNTDVTSITIRVRGCGAQFLAGATVAFTSGSYTFTITSDASGLAVWSHAPAGAWSASISKARFVSTTTSGTVACNVAGSADLTLTVATGYHCWNNSLCADPAPETVYLTDPVTGLVTLTWNAGTTRWEGTATVPRLDIRNASCLSPAAGNWTVHYQIVGGSALFWFYAYMCCPSTCFPTSVSSGYQDGPITAGGIQRQSQPNSPFCSIFGLTYTARLEFAPSNGLAGTYGTSALTFSLSE